MMQAAVKPDRLQLQLYAYIYVGVRLLAVCTTMLVVSESRLLLQMLSGCSARRIFSELLEIFERYLELWTCSACISASPCPQLGLWLFPSGNDC